MPRDGSNIYHRPPGTDAVTDTTIESSKYNANVADVEQDLNTPRPIVAGGTGASDAATAIANLGGERAAQVVTNYDAQVFVAGSFYSAAGATSAPVAGHAFAGICYVTDAANMVIEARDLGDALTTPGRIWVRQKKAGVWLAWAGEPYVLKTGDVMSGNLKITSPSPGFILDKTAAGTPNSNYLIGQLNTITRWAVELGNGIAETGSNVGSNFVVNRYADDGSFLGSPLTIARSTGDAYFSSILSVAGNFGASLPIGVLNVKTGTNQNIGFSNISGACLFVVNDANNAYVPFRVKASTVNFDAPVVTGSDLSVGGSLYIAGTGIGLNGLTFAFSNTNYVSLFERTGNATIILGSVGADPSNYFRHTKHVFQNLAGTVLFGQFDSTGLTVPSAYVQPVGGANPTVYFNNASGTQVGVVYYDLAQSWLSLFNIAGSGQLQLRTDGVVRCSGLLGRTGVGGGFGGSSYSFNWTGVLDAWVDSTRVGSVSMTSDYRTKKDVTELPGMWDTVKALRPIRYTQAEFSPPSHMEHIDKTKETAPGHLFLADDIERFGFIAHELQETLTASAASGVKDSPDIVQSPNPFTVLAAVTKALQEAMVRIEALEAR